MKTKSVSVSPNDVQRVRRYLDQNHIDYTSGNSTIAGYTVFEIDGEEDFDYILNVLQKNRVKFSLKESIKSVLKEHIRKILLKEEKIDPTVDAYWRYLSKMDKSELLRIAQSKSRINSLNSSIPKADLINHIITAEHGINWSKPLRTVPPYIEPYIKKPKLKENNESEQIAIDLIDYMGKQLPRMNWKMDRRISGFFQELGMNINDPEVAKIYQIALRLNR